MLRFSKSKKGGGGPNQVFLLFVIFFDNEYGVRRGYIINLK